MPFDATPEEHYGPQRPFPPPPFSRLSPGGLSGREQRGPCAVPDLRCASSGMTSGPSAKGSDVRPHLLLQQRRQLGLHEGVVVGDVEADDAGALQMGPEAALEPGAVGALHDEDDVGPFHQFGGALLLRIGRQAGGGGLDAGP